MELPYCHTILTKHFKQSVTWEIVSPSLWTFVSFKEVKPPIKSENFDSSSFKCLQDHPLLQGVSKKCPILVLTISLLSKQPQQQFCSSVCVDFQAVKTFVPRRIMALGMSKLVRVNYLEYSRSLTKMLLKQSIVCKFRAYYFL